MEDNEYKTISLAEFDDFNLVEEKITKKKHTGNRKTHEEFIKELNTITSYIEPLEYYKGARAKILCRCKICGCKWKVSPDSILRGTGCPKCSMVNHTSFPEQAIFFYIKKAFSSAVNSYKDIFSDGMELDVYIPELKVGIEYDGQKWHTNKKRDNRKYEICVANGIKLIRISEGTQVLSCDKFIKSTYTASNKKILNPIIEELLRYLNGSCDVDVIRDEIKIKEQYYQNRKQISLVVKCPEISKEWNYNRNGTLTPDMVLPGSGDKVWWKCSTCGYEWQAYVYVRTGKEKAGCPACAGKVVIKGCNDLKHLDQN